MDEGTEKLYEDEVWGWQAETGPTGRQIIWAWVVLGLFTVATLYFGWYGSWLVGWPR